MPLCFDTVTNAAERVNSRLSELRHETLNLDAVGVAMFFIVARAHQNTATTAGRPDIQGRLTGCLRIQYAAHHSVYSYAEPLDHSQVPVLPSTAQKRSKTLSSG